MSDEQTNPADLNVTHACPTCGKVHLPPSPPENGPVG